MATEDQDSTRVANAQAAVRAVAASDAKPSPEDAKANPEDASVTMQRYNAPAS